MRFAIHVLVILCALANSALAERLSEDAASGAQSYILMDVSTGAVLEQYQANKPMPPASVAKIPTALYALDKLGANWRFETKFIRTNQNELGVIGAGDPALDTDALVRVAAQMRALGFVQPKGETLLYAGALPYQSMVDKTQLSHVSYNPAISGLNLNFNRVYFEWKKQAEGYAVGLSAKTKNYAPPVRSVTITPANRKQPVYRYQDNGSDAWSVAAPALGNGGSRWLPVRNTSAYFADVFRRVAADQGVRLPRAKEVDTPPLGQVIAVEQSALLQDLLRGMLRYSTNITAETIGLRASIQTGQRPSSVAQSAKQMNGWLEQRFGVSGAMFVDHSGLNNRSRIRAQELGLVLVASAPRLRPLLKEVDLRDANWQKAPIEGVSVVAKTGTLNFVSGLAGYVTTASGRDLAFVIFTSDMAKHNAVPKAQKERPDGGRIWARQSRVFQHALLRDWAERY